MTSKFSTTESIINTIFQGPVVLAVKMSIHIYRCCLLQNRLLETKHINSLPGRPRLQSVRKCASLVLCEGKLFTVLASSKLNGRQTWEGPQNMQTSLNQASVPKKAAYCEIALRTATSRIEAFEKELHEMQSIIADLEKKRHEAETKACVALRRAQDSETRYNISDKRRQDAEKKTRELEKQITDAISLAQQPEVGTEEASRFDKIRGIFDNHAFEESKKRVDAEHRAHDLMKKRAEAEAKCLEETERRVQAEVRARQEMRIRIDEEMRNKALRSKLRDAEEKFKIIELQNRFSLDCEKRKGAEAGEAFKLLLKQAHQSLALAEQKRKEAELKGVELEQQLSSAEARAVDFEMKLEDTFDRQAELQVQLNQARTDFERELEDTSRELGNGTGRLGELQMVLGEVVPHDVKSSKITISLGRPPDYATAMQAIAEQEENYVKVGELQTLNAELEVTMRELKENMQRHEDNDLKIFDLHSVNEQLEGTIQELKQRLEQEDRSRMQLQATVEELEDTVREQTQKLDRLKAFEGSTECRRLGDSLIALRVEENPLFRREPGTDDLQSNFLSRPDSVTDDSQTSPMERPDLVACKTQQILFARPVMVGSDSEANLVESPKSITEDGDENLYPREKQYLLQKLGQNDALITELRGRIQDGHTKQSELELELKEAVQLREAAEMKADALLGQLKLTLQREKERDSEYQELSGTTSFRGKKEKWGILDRFRSKSKLENV